MVKLPVSCTVSAMQFSEGAQAPRASPWQVCTCRSPAWTVTSAPAPRRVGGVRKGAIRVIPWVTETVRTAALAVENSTSTVRATRVPQAASAKKS